MAEFDNFRKRTEKEKTQMYDMGAKSIIEKILPVIDNFERGLAAVPQVDNIRSPFRYNPKPLKVVFVDFAYEVALESAMWGSRSEVDEFITVVSGQSASRHGNPKEALPVFVDIIDKIIGKPFIHG